MTTDGERESETTPEPAEASPADADAADTPPDNVAATPEVTAPSRAPNAGEASEAGQAEEDDALRRKRSKPEARGKRRARKSRSKDEGDADDRVRERRNTLIWVAAIGLLLTIELYLFGRNGYIDVCIGRDGITDFGLVGEPVTQETSRKAPLCQRRHNLGMQSRYDEELKAGLRQACQRANATFGTRDVMSCINGKDPWAHWIASEQVPPWHEAFYKQMLWFLF